jgi:hypothetical protein
MDARFPSDILIRQKERSSDKKTLIAVERIAQSKKRGRKENLGRG